MRISIVNLKRLMLAGATTAGLCGCYAAPVGPVAYAAPAPVYYAPEYYAAAPVYPTYAYPSYGYYGGPSVSLNFGRGYGGGGWHGRRW